MRKVALGAAFALVLSAFPLATAVTTASSAGAAAAWATWSAQQDWSGPDVVDSGRHNRADWYSAHNWTAPYPGDPRILFPNEVPDGPGDGD